MQLNPNIQIDQNLADRITAQKLTCIDLYNLSAAEALCKIYPDITVYLVPQQQIIAPPPAIFVDVAKLSRSKELNDVKRWDIMTNLAYMSDDTNALSEQISAATAISDMAESIPDIAGGSPYRIYSTEINFVDGIVNVAGTLTLYEQKVDNSPIINFAKTNVYIKE